MKSLLCALAIVLSLARLDAAVLNLKGKLDWDITEPRTTFTLNGDLQNLSAEGSGNIRLVLWATQNPFPSPGFLIAQYELGPLGGGTQFSDFTVKTTSNIPAITGNFYFTIAVAEFNGSIWVNKLAVPTGIESLLAGDFTGQKKWKFPSNPVIAPKASINSSNIISLTEKATVLRNLFPIRSQVKTTIDIGKGTKARFSNIFSEDSAVTYNYRIGLRKFKGSKMPVGILSLDFKNPDNQTPTTATFTFFYYTATSGIYKSREETGSDTEIVWGTFTIQ